MKTDATFHVNAAAAINKWQFREELFKVIPLLVTDDDGAIKLATPPLEALFGYAAGELNGQQVEVLITADPVEVEKHVVCRKMYALDRSVRAMGATSQVHGRKKDGMSIPVHVTLLPSVINEEHLTVAIVTSAQPYGDGCTVPPVEKSTNPEPPQPIITVTSGTPTTPPAVTTAVTLPDKSPYCGKTGQIDLESFVYYPIAERKLLRHLAGDVNVKSPLSNVIVSLTAWMAAATGIVFFVLYVLPMFLRSRP